jgi:selenocysteine lyase/cysteine desulfurase
MQEAYGQYLKGPLDGNLIRKIRAEFPRCESDANGRKRAFFDNGTGTLVVGRAVQAYAKTLTDCSATVGASFDESHAAEAAFSEGRKAVADLLNAPSPENIVAGESTGNLLFKLSYALGKQFSGRENIVTTDYEHYANISPWIELEKRHAIRELRFARIDKDEWTLDMEHLKELIDDNTRVVTVTAASNLLGTKSPLQEIAKIAREVNAYFVVDGVHHVSHGPVDVQALDCDFYVFSGYKLFTTPEAFLYGREEHLKALQPYTTYGPFSSSVPPSKWEGRFDQGVFAAICGVADHLSWISDLVKEQYEEQFTGYSGRARSLKIAMSAIEKYSEEQSRAVLEGLDDAPGLLAMPHVKVYGLTDLDRLDERDPTFAFKVKNMPDEEVARLLWTKYGIALRASNFASRVLEVLDVSTMVRAALTHYNNLEEIYQFLKALDDIGKTLK